MSESAFMSVSAAPPFGDCAVLWQKSIFEVTNAIGEDGEHFVVDRRHRADHLHEIAIREHQDRGRLECRHSGTDGSRRAMPISPKKSAVLVLQP